MRPGARSPTGEAATLTETVDDDFAGPRADRGRLDLLCLTMVPGVGPLTCRALLDRFGTATRVLDAPTSSLRDVPNVGPKLAGALRSARQDFDPTAELAEARRLGVAIVARGEPGYPPPLEQLVDAPPLLYVRGAIEPRDPLAIAIVGARHATPYGLRIADRLAAGLARVGITVVSGLARGIDAAAHRGALRAGGRTLAVLGNGLGAIYPPEHEDLARSVAGSGALLSESALGVLPLPGMFPQRNRLIAGLSLGVVVVEAATRSGSLSTATHAAEQNREVFAVPGPVDSLQSRGCHALIRDGAKLVETIDDILEELGPLAAVLPADPGEPEAARPAHLPLNDQERAILGLLATDRATGADELIAATGLTASQVMATLSVLEVRRLVRRVPGGFVRA